MNESQIVAWLRRNDPNEKSVYIRLRDDEDITLAGALVVLSSQTMTRCCCNFTGAETSAWFNGLPILTQSLDFCGQKHWN